MWLIQCFLNQCFSKRKTHTKYWQCQRNVTCSFYKCFHTCDLLLRFSSFLSTVISFIWFWGCFWFKWILPSQHFQLFSCPSTVASGCPDTVCRMRSKPEDSDDCPFVSGALLFIPYWGWQVACFALVDRDCLGYFLPWWHEGSWWTEDKSLGLTWWGMNGLWCPMFNA